MQEIPREWGPFGLLESETLNNVMSIYDTYLPLNEVIKCAEHRNIHSFEKDINDQEKKQAEEMSSFM